MAQKTLTGVLILATCCFYQGCRRYVPQQEGLAPYISISPDDNKILFSWYQNGKASLYVADVNGSNVQRLTSAKNESYIEAVYSHDGSKILFLAYRENDGRPFSDICIMDANGTNLQRLTSSKQYINEAIFSPDGKTIYYLQSNFFGHYSPITGSRPHEFDIYSINLNSTSPRRITNLHEYEMFGLSVTSDGRHLLFGSGPLDPERRPFAFHQLLIDNPNKIVSFNPSGQFGSDTFSELQLSSDDRTAAFVAVAPNKRGGYKYELYIMDFESKYSRQITNLQRNIESACFMHGQPRIIFTVNTTWPIDPPIYELCSVNADGTDLKKINLSITNPR